MKRELTGREKNLIVAALAIVFCSLFTVYLILPLWTNYGVVRVELESTSAGLNKLKEEKKAGAATKDIAKIESEVNTMRKQLPPAANTAELLYYLSKAAEKSGVALDNFEVSTPKKKTSSQEQAPQEKAIYAKVTVLGGFARIRNFVAQTESLTRLTHNKAVSIGEIKDPPGKLAGTIEFNAFMAASDSGKSKTGSDVPKAVTGKQSPFNF